MRVFNFSPGPSMLFLPVLEKAQRELVEHESSGMSVMEMSHRSKMFEAIHKGAQDAMRRVMGIPANYKILFLQGGATMQFAQVPMNLMKTGTADYVVTGSFAKKAAEEAKKFGAVKVVASSADRNFAYIPKLTKDMFSPAADYVHITTNNTIFGTSFRGDIPDTGSIPLVADMSSNILSEVMDVSKFGLIYAGAQKNIGPSGLTVVIIREDLISEAAKTLPTMLSYKVMADEDSMHNTPPTYAIYIAKLTFEYLESIGGVPVMQIINERKAAKLYDCLDRSKLFTPTADKEARSIMNVTFVGPSDELNDKFVKQATAAGLVNLKGHRSVGGMRASIYNAMPEEGVEALVSFIEKFERENG